jgi:hypothetical protein
MATKRKIDADAIRGNGHLESFTLSSVLSGAGAGENTSLLATHLKKPLSTEEIELMLSNQAIVLNALANKKIEMGANMLMGLQNNAKLEEMMKSSLRDGFKAIELSRKCLMALNEVRNPKRSTFIKQQLNQLNLNGDHDASKKMDRIAEGTSKRIDPTMATVETLDRCEDARG